MQGQLGPLAACCSEVHAAAASLQAGNADESASRQHSAALHAAAQQIASAQDPLPAALVTQLVDAASRFWAFGRRPTVQPLVASRSSGSATKPGRYIPPSQRSSAVGSEGSSGAPPSDPEPSALSAPYKLTVAVRLAAMQVLQELARSDSAALHALWDRLLPSTEPLNEAARPVTLTNALLFDPSAKMRSAAAATTQLVLSGKKTKAFMAVAESASGHAGAARSFTTLSGSLAAMLESMHAALTAALRKERSLDVQLDLLKLASTFIAQAPYARLAPGLLPSLAESIVGKWRPEKSSAREEVRHCCCSLAMKCQRSSLLVTQNRLCLGLTVAGLHQAVRLVYSCCGLSDKTHSMHAICLSCS